MGIRRHLKSTIERGALLSGIPGALRRRRKGETLVLAYHDIVPTGAHAVGDSSLHMPQAHFAAQLDELARTHEIIPLSRAFYGHVGERPSVVITFDDAYQGALTAGVSELERRGLPGTFFVAPGYVNGGDFWWDALADASEGAPSPALRARALSECCGRNADVRALAASEHLATVATMPPFARGASEAELATAAACEGITFGSHSYTHPNLSALEDDALWNELITPLGWLQDRYDNVLPMISYPYGIASPRVERVAKEAGYIAGFRIDGGWMTAEKPNPFALPRLDVPSGVSAAGFALRAAGVRVK